MKKYFLILLISLFAVFSSTAQTSKWKNWYFGNHAALTWCGVQAGNDPLPLTNSDMFAIEGSASISDNNCNMLFYSDGIRIWDANDDVMSNTDFSSSTGNLAGCYSSGQACLIVQKPGNQDIYYVFTTDCAENNYAQGLRYSTVDMTLNNGFGDVVLAEKNILMLDSANEALCGIYHDNNEDIWVVSRQFNTHDYYAFLVSSAGIAVSSPIVSSIGFNTDVFKIKISRGCPKLAAIGQGWPAAIEMMHFDKSTGLLTDNIILAQTIRRGVEFSPNGKLLYFSSFTSLYQYDVSVHDSSYIVESMVLLDTMQSLACDLQLGPDNKIYEAQVNAVYLNRIENPNELGINCNFVNDAILLGPSVSSANKSYFGLPNIITPGCHDDFAPIDLGSDKVVCEGDTLLFDAGPQWENYLWSTGDTTQSILVANTGIYSVTAHSCCNVHEGSINVTILALPLVQFIADTIYSSLNTPLLLVPDITDGYAYAWSTGETSSEIYITQEGTYTITVTGTSGCKQTASVYVAESVGVNEALKNAPIKIYPNPGSGLFSIDLPATYKNNGICAVYSLQGELIFKTPISSNNISIDLLQYKAGVYVLNISNAQFSSVIRLIKF